MATPTPLPAPNNPWYNSTWFGTLAAITIGLILIYFTIRLLPKRRMYYGMELITSLLKAPSDTKDDLQLHYKNKLLNRPYIVRINIALRGRKDLASGDYDNAQPLQLDLGSQIIELLEVTSKPTTAPAPTINQKETSIQIGPSLITVGQKIAIGILVDGSRPVLTCVSPLKDVKVRRQKESSTEVDLLLMGPQTVVVIGVIAGVAAYNIQMFVPRPWTLTTGWLTVLLLFIALACQDMDDHYSHSKKNKVSLEEQATKSIKM